MAIARILQWLKETPLIHVEYRDRIQDNLEKVEMSELMKWLMRITSSKEEKIRRAKLHALEIAEEKEVHYQFREHFGYLRLWVYTKRHYQYRLDFGNKTHFLKRMKDKPKNLRNGGKVWFLVRSEPLPQTDPTKTSSYLEIESVK